MSISRAPGRNASTSPSPSARARRIVAATWSSSRGSTRRPSGGVIGPCGGDQCTSTGKRRASARDRAGAAEHLGQALRVGGRRGGQHAQVGAQRGAHLDQEGQGQVGVEVAFVALVEDHHGGAGQLGVALQAADQDAGGDHLDQGVGGDAAVTPHRITDPAADLPRPADAAIRRAAARAATRRGSATTTRPPSAASASGTSVVLPVPGGATSTAAPGGGQGRRSSGRTARIGRSGRACSAISTRPSSRRPELSDPRERPC